MPNDDTLKILIVDDERAARHRLEVLLQSQPGVEVVGEAVNGRQAVEAIKRTNPDLVFLDVHMPGMSGLDVVREIGPLQMPAVIFVTAYDQYAIEAFDVAALDYLLKPFDDERFEQTLTRARSSLAVRAVEELQRRLSLLLGTTTEQPEPIAPSKDEPHYLKRIGVELRGRMRIVPVEQIDFITANGSYVELHINDETYVIRERMQDLEVRLDPDCFFRIHRSTIVQLDKIESLIHSGGGDYAVRMQDGQQLSVSRSRYEELHAALGLRASDDM
jgi:two-component system LytT family response regulator